MSDLGTFLGKIAGKITNAANTDRKLKCASCDAITEHAAISYAEMFKAIDNNSDNLLRDILGFTQEIIPQPLVCGNPYACTKCKRLRFEGGILSNDITKR